MVIKVIFVAVFKGVINKRTNIDYLHHTFWFNNLHALMKFKEESEKAGLKLNAQKTKIMASGPMTSWQIDGKTMETVRDKSDFFGRGGGLQNHCRW